MSVLALTCVLTHNTCLIYNNIIKVNIVKADIVKADIIKVNIVKAFLY